MVHRATRRATPILAFTPIEIELLARTAAKKEQTKHGPAASLGDYLNQLARPGGYLNRSNGGPPGITVVWRGMARLMDIAFGFELASGTCG